MPVRVVRMAASNPRLRRSVDRVLRGNVLCSMATVRIGGLAHINTAYFCHSPEGEIFFLSYPTSIHARNVRKNPSMAVAIFSSDQTWGKPDRGIQLFGTCHRATGTDVPRGMALYRRRFPQYGGLATELEGLRLYRFVPRRIKVLDERVFGGGVFVSATLGGNRRG